MLGVFFLGILVCDAIKGKHKKAAELVIDISAIINILIVAVAISRKVLLYDTRIIWECSQLVVSIILIIICFLELKKEKEKRFELIAYVLIHIAVLLDFTGVGYHTYYSGICFKASFMVMLFVFLLQGVKQVVVDYQASIKNKKMKEELENSRITVMLSQIQPHFLYNSLTTVMDLCDRDPKQAKAAIADFAGYLRGNLSSLKTENLISFGTELEHIEKYLRLEKLRFQDELEVVYDIQTRDFMLPALSVQPLVENAVKHGVGRKIGGGTVTINTTETEDEYIICVTDDGVGFTEGEYSDDGGTHVGIENIKKRLDMMINARLEIESKIGEGTKACILIPKRRD
jgi:two-component sensor histidine kinase